MSTKEAPDPKRHLEIGESPNRALSELAELARQAYEQRRMEDCLDLTREMLLIDPNDGAAWTRRLSIQSEMKQAPERDGLDPSHLPSFDPTSSRKRAIRWLVGASAFVIAGVLVVSLPKFGRKSNPVEAPLMALGASDNSKPIASENAVELRSPDPKPAAIVEKPPLRVSTPQPVPKTTVEPAQAPAPIPASALADQPAVASTGSLAISSPTTVDIYENDAYLGAAPVSLQLSAGTHTLEYRHGSLRKNLTHNINSDRTVKVTITFEVNVQINSKPWAEVFMDGADKKDLGQTPLSGVRVPIGSVLVFQNPQFQAKKYRITGNETGIQNFFP